MTNFNKYYTLKGYELNSNSDLTAAMEDYLEMIYRVSTKNEYVRTVDISSLLNVKPSSVSKMISHLAEVGYIKPKKYGYIYLTDKGKEEGEYLLYRHNVIHNFLCFINKSDNELEQAEKIEHFFDKNTVRNLDSFMKKMT